MVASASGIDSTSTSTRCSSSSANWSMRVLRQLATARSRMPMSKFCSWARTRSSFARVVGFTEITPQYSGILAANSWVPMAAIRTISSLSVATRGRSTRVSVTSSITARLRRVWLLTCATLSPVTSASTSSSLARRSPTRNIMRLRITPIWLSCTLPSNSATTSSKGTLMNSTRWLQPYFCHRYRATSLTPISWSRPPRLKNRKWVRMPRFMVR